MIKGIKNKKGQMKKIRKGFNGWIKKGVCFDYFNNNNFNSCFSDYGVWVYKKLGKERGGMCQFAFDNSPSLFCVNVNPNHDMDFDILG